MWEFYFGTMFGNMLLNEKKTKLFFISEGVLLAGYRVSMEIKKGKVYNLELFLFMHPRRN